MSVAAVRCLAFLLPAVMAMAADPSGPAITPAPPGAELSRAFAVSARHPGGPWSEVPVYDTRVDLHTRSHAAFAGFDMAGPVEVRVVRAAGAPATWTIRPLAAGIVVKSVDGAAIFTLDRPRNLAIEADGDRLRNLHLFANPPDDPPPAAGPDVIRFAPGLHRLGDHPAITSDGKVGTRAKAVIRLRSGTTLHLAAGAIVQAAIVVERGAHDVVIRGRGILDLSPWNEEDGHFHKGSTWQTGAITLPAAHGVRIEGITVKQPTGYTISGGNAEDIAIDNLKSFSCHEWADGIDMMSSSRIRIRDCFLRTSDDCIAVYGSRFGFHGDSRDWEVSGCALWADKAHAIYVGVHGDYEHQGDTIAGLVFRDLDVLENDEGSDGFWGALSIGCGDRNTVRDVLFERIRVEHIRDAGGRLIDIQFKHYQPSTVDGHAISGIAFRDIAYDGPHGSLIAGRSPEQVVSGVTFENLVLGGKPARDAAAARLTVGPHVEGVSFR